MKTKKNLTHLGMEKLGSFFPPSGWLITASSSNCWPSGGFSLQVEIDVDNDEFNYHLKLLQDQVWREVDFSVSSAVEWETGAD